MTKEDPKDQLTLTHFQTLEERIKKIEDLLQDHMLTRSTMSDIPPEIPSPPPHPVSANAKYSAKPSPALKKESPPARGSYLGILAIICFILAASFIIKLTLQSGWFTPERQLGPSALLGPYSYRCRIQI